MIRIALERFAIALFFDAVTTQRRNNPELKSQPLPTWNDVGTDVRHAYRENAAQLLLEQASNQPLSDIMQDLLS